MRLENAVFLEGVMGIVIIDNANTGSSYPKFGIFHDVETDHNLTNAMQMWAGTDYQVDNCWLG